MASTSSSSSATTAAASRQDKFRTGLEHKSRGNQAFLSNDIKAALQSYHLAVLYLSGLENRSILGLVGENSGTDGKPEDLSSDEQGEQDEQPAPLTSPEAGEKQLSAVYSNMAACYLKQNNFPRAIETAEKSLKCDSKNLKAKYRKAQALRLGGDVYKAKSYLQDTIAGLKTKKSGTKQSEAIESFETELKAVEKLIRDKEGMARNKWKGFLGKNPKVFDVGDAAAGAKEQGKGKGKAKEDNVTEQSNKGAGAEASS
ncbi:hypothetical protein NDA16_002290 [Ustilago loliicola]|nr:hypothetical protein NDA16_002290 [Ustilago loliicola]